MSLSLRALARRLLGVTRTPTYYLPWLTRPGLDCALILNNVEARFMEGHRQGPFPVSAIQYDAGGAVVRRYEATLADSTDTVELGLEPTAGGCGFVTVDVSRIHSDLYVTLSDGAAYTATHGRHEFVETYPVWTRAVMAALGAALALFGRTIPAFTRHQFVYSGSDSRSHVLLMNLSNVRNRIRVAVSRDGAALGARLVGLPPMGARLLDVSTLAPAPARGTQVLRLLLQGNAWFNLYLVGAGPRDMAGPLSLMHVK
jgi:hypothetical protein